LINQDMSAMSAIQFDKTDKEYTCLDMILSAKTVNANYEIPYEI